MPKHVTVPLDAFAIGMDELIGDIPPVMESTVSRAVEKNTRKGVKAVKGQASKGGKHAWSGEYIGGFSSHIERGAYTTGEIGNRAKPGLVHLLEKGHATLTGRRTNAYPHMAPAFDEIKDGFYNDVADAVMEALS